MPVHVLAARVIPALPAAGEQDPGVIWGPRRPFGFGQPVSPGARLACWPRPVPASLEDGGCPRKDRIAGHVLQALLNIERGIPASSPGLSRVFLLARLTAAIACGSHLSTDCP